MAYLTIISRSKSNWNALTPEFTAISTAKTREGLIRQAREALALALGNDQWPQALITTLEEIDPEIRAELDGTEEVVFLEPAPMNPVSLEIAQALAGADVTQAELARRLGTSRSAVNRMVNPFYWGHSMEVLRRVAEALNMKIEVKLSAA